MNSNLPINLVFGGDVCLQTMPSMPTEEECHVWRTIAEAAAVVANLESALTSRGQRAPKCVAHRVPAEVAHILRRLGFNLVTLANNHSMDFGPEGLDDTLRALDEAGIQHCGAGRNSHAAFSPGSIEIDRVRVAICGFSCAAPPGSLSSIGQASPLFGLRRRTSVILWWSSGDASELNATRRRPNHERLCRFRLVSAHG